MQRADRRHRLEHPVARLGVGHPASKVSLLGNSTGTARLMNCEPVTVVGSPLRSLRISLASFFGFGVVGFRSAHSCAERRLRLRLGRRAGEPDARLVQQEVDLGDVRGAVVGLPLAVAEHRQRLDRRANVGRRGRLGRQHGRGDRGGDDECQHHGQHQDSVSHVSTPLGRQRAGRTGPPDEGQDPFPVKRHPPLLLAKASCPRPGRPCDPALKTTRTGPRAGPTIGSPPGLRWPCAPGGSQPPVPSAAC